MSSDIKAFEVATKKVVEEDEGTKFEIPDLMAPNSKKDQTRTTITAYQPDEGQFAMLMAMTGRGATQSDRIAGIINFFVNILDEEGSDYLQSRLLNRLDPFGIDDVEQIMDWLSEQWTGNPTQGPSGSTPSPSNAGPKSTEPIPLLT